MVAISGTIILRILIGAISDGLGIRITYTVLLIAGCIPGFLLAAANSYIAITLLRFLIGFAGASFVLTQLWTTIMFDLNVVGIANATSAGWGNLGGGVAQVIPLTHTYTLHLLNAEVCLAKPLRWKIVS